MDSNPQIPVPQPLVASQGFGAALPGHAAFLQDDVAVGDAHQAADVFVDHDQRLAGGAQLFDAAPDFFADQRRQAFGGFVKMMASRG